MRWKFAFGLASDDLFFVTTKRDLAPAGGVSHLSKVTTFPNEDEFLGHIIRAALREDETIRLISAVLLSVAQPIAPPPWIVVDLSQAEMENLRLSGPGAVEEECDAASGKDLYLQAARLGSLPQFYDLLMQAPVAISVVIGPEHRYSFVNEQYAKLIGVTSVAKVLGTSAVHRYAGDQRNSISEVLDRVYRTGEPYVGSETPHAFFHEDSSTVKESYFNTVCQPITNAYGEVAGIMVQTTDVTEMVLARDVREQRERQLYRQWAELEAIYRSAPVAMMLIDAKDFRILRLNEKQAELLGRGVAELRGWPLCDVVREPAELKRILAKVLRGEPVKEHIVEGALWLSPAIHRYWLKSYAPILSEGGRVESIILVALEISEETKVAIEAAAMKELEVMA